MKIGVKNKKLSCKLDLVQTTIDGTLQYWTQGLKKKTKKQKSKGKNIKVTTT